MVKERIIESIERIKEISEKLLQAKEKLQDQDLERYF